MVFSNVVSDRGCAVVKTSVFFSLAIGRSPFGSLRGLHLWPGTSNKHPALRRCHSAEHGSTASTVLPALF